MYAFAVCVFELIIRFVRGGLPPPAGPVPQNGFCLPRAPGGLLNLGKRGEPHSSRGCWLYLSLHERGDVDEHIDKEGTMITGPYIMVILSHCAIHCVLHYTHCSLLLHDMTPTLERRALPSLRFHGMAPRHHLNGHRSYWRETPLENASTVFSLVSFPSMVLLLSMNHRSLLQAGTGRAGVRESGRQHARLGDRQGRG